MQKKIAILILLSTILQLYVFADIRLPKLISDGLILQRDANVNVWGWADPNEKISITIDNKNYTTVADSAGNWKLCLAPHKAGGACTMVLKGNNRLEIRNITFGEVWICSGQSNMELPMRRVRLLYGDLMKTASNPDIRQFIVPQKYNFQHPEVDVVSGEWQSVNPQTIQNFSAVAYFFASALYQKYKIPVGIINASLGGSPIQAWMSEEALKRFPDYLNEACKWRDDEAIRSTEKTENKQIAAWYAEANRKDAGHSAMPWSAPIVDDSAWPLFSIPGYWTDSFPSVKNGVVWFRKEFTLSKRHAGEKAFLNMGRIVDADSVFINGRCVGTTGYQYPPRWYDVSPDVLQEGRNVIVVRVVSNAGKGGFVLDKPYELRVGDTICDLKGIWKMKQGCDMDVTPSQTFIRWKPMGLFNAMIAPLCNFTCKGVVWYQGEANTAKPEEYAQLLPAMIADWRKAFGQPELNFVYAQLPGFMEVRPEPSESNWAKLRESQLKTLTVKRTGMAVTIDAGEWNDIHPLNKKTVGERLAQQAMRIAYNEKFKQPAQVKTIRIENNSIQLVFNCELHTIANAVPRLVAIAGNDRQFVWAVVKIKGKVMSVRSGKVPHPVAVRYAWADNPADANICDAVGNLISPFRTDNW